MACETARDHGNLNELEAELRRCEFTTHEFRKLVLAVAPELHPDLSEEKTPVAQIEAGVALLARHGLLGATFFHIWLSIRPGRRERITEVAAKLAVAVPESGPRPLASEPTAYCADTSKRPPREPNRWHPDLLPTFAGVAFFLLVLHGGRNHPNRYVLWTGAFFIGVIAPHALPSDRLVAIFAMAGGS